MMELQKIEQPLAPTDPLFSAPCSFEGSRKAGAMLKFIKEQVWSVFVAVSASLAPKTGWSVWTAE